MATWSPFERRTSGQAGDGVSEAFETAVGDIPDDENELRSFYKSVGVLGDPELVSDGFGGLVAKRESCE